MKKLFFSLLLSLVALAGFAQSAGDKLVGIYYIDHDGEHSKVKFTKTSNNTYQGQVIWLENAKDKDGNPRKDIKNPDKSKRNVPADQIVLIEKVSYKDGVWTDGEIYDPTRGKSFNVELRFKDAKTLAVKGSWGFFSQTVYWTKLEEKK